MESLLKRRGLYCAEGFDHADVAGVDDYEGAGEQIDADDGNDARAD